jgi:hypothetical protein
MYGVGVPIGQAQKNPLKQPIMHPSGRTREKCVMIGPGTAEVGVGVRVIVRVAVTVRVCVAVREGVPVRVGEPVAVSVPVRVTVRVTVPDLVAV